ncbi:MAG TPA: hypothetical protein VEC16_00535 [Alphaproteobacteria bacterium]|nr:hypothetical protein [Alphaproteobacteria bacterium]
MVNPAIIDWIKRQEAKGYSSQQIYLHLVNNGYDQKDVIEAVNMSNAMSGNPGGYRQNYGMQGMQNSQINQPNYSSNNSNKNSSSSASHKGLLIVLAILLVLGGGGYYAYSSGTYINAIDYVNSMLNKDSSGNGNEVSQDVQGSSDVQNTVSASSDTQTQQPDGLTVSELLAQQQSTDSEIDDITGLAISQGCNEYADNLMTCTVYACTIKEPVMDSDVTIRILGFIDGKCKVTTDLYDGVVQECNYDEEFRQKAAAESAEAKKAEQEGREPLDPNDPNSVSSQAYEQGICVIDDGSASQ